MMNTTSLPFSSKDDKKFWDYFYSDDEQMNVTEPVELTVPNPDQGYVVGLYSALLAVGGFGNIAVMASLVRSRRRKSRVTLLMTHLTIADMIVTFIVIPLEIAWKTTNAWLAGNVACKVFLVLRAFGLYLSSNVLVCISLDRFFAVLYPLRLPVARKRSKTMLGFAWIIAFLCSFPQSMVFRVLLHPTVPNFEQCVSFDVFPSHGYELAYNVSCLSAMYFLPLLIITVCYTRIFYEISKNSKETSANGSNSEPAAGRVQLRRSDERPLARARRRTLRMTLTIVTVFAFCWLPYAIMTLWYMLDRASAEQVSERLQDLFFVMAVSNSCMDPLVYGSYAFDLHSFLSKSICKIFLTKKVPTESKTESGRGTAKTKLPTLNRRGRDDQVVQRPVRRTVRFDETSFCVRSGASSDPLPACGGDELMNISRVTPSRSCEIFSVQVAVDTHRYN